MFTRLKDAIFNKESIMQELPKIVNKLYPKEVLEIHNEFNIAADNLLLEANSIIAEAKSKDIEKVNRLEALGFKQVKQVVETKPLLEQAKLSQEQIEAVNYYKREYPFNKFITNKQVEDICKKYGLVCGDVSLFKGFVPEKNLKEIEKFKLKDKEKNVLIASNGWVFKNAEIKKKNSYWHIYKRNETDKFRYAFQSNDGINFYANDTHNIFGYSHINNGRNFTIENNSLKICAPLKDMDTTGMDLTDGYKLEKKFIPDPIVLQPVEFGFLILAMWADETFDPFTEPILRNDTINN
jgi:hypothetical protein